MNSTDYNQTQLRQTEFTPDPDGDIARLAAEIDDIFDEIAAENKGSRIAEFIHGTGRDTVNSNTEQIARVGTLVDDAIGAALPVGENVGYDQGRLEAQPTIAQDYARNTGEPLTGAHARFAEMTKQLPLTAIAEKTHTAEAISDALVAYAADITRARSDFTDAPRDALDIGELV